MTAISASTVRVQTMADGTLRITLDIEPREAREAFALFGMPGTPAALAALKVGTAALGSEAEKPKGGPLAQWAAIRATEKRFQDWLEAYSCDAATKRIKLICGIESRAELDNDPRASAVFKRQVMQPWREYCRSQGWDE